MFQTESDNFTRMTAFGVRTSLEELQHLVSYDSKGQPLEGGKKYRLHLPANIPASEFWSIIVYDSLTRLIIHTDQPWPSVYFSDKNLMYNADGSIDVWFGPESIKEANKNWVKTIPGKRWLMILRLYNPLETWFNKEWKPGEIVELL